MPSIAFGKKKKREERREEMGETRVLPLDRCRIRSSSKIVRVRFFFSLLFLWEIDVRLWQFLWIS